MAIPKIQMQVRGLDELKKKLADAPEAYNQALADAGTLVGDAVLNTRGLKSYPPATAANQPPTPYYIRGRGTETARGNLHNSERLGTTLYAIGEKNARGEGGRFIGGVAVRIGSKASYAKHVIGDDQARAMARIGWRKLSDVANEKRGRIKEIFETVIRSALKRVGF